MSQALDRAACGKLELAQCEQGVAGVDAEPALARDREDRGGLCAALLLSAAARRASGEDASMERCRVRLAVSSASRSPSEAVTTADANRPSLASPLAR